jgi:hypothetical protein
MAAFERLIRFESADGQVKYGNLEKEMPTREIEGSEVELLEGDVKSGFRKGGGRERVGKVSFCGCLFWWEMMPICELSGGRLQLYISLGMRKEESVQRLVLIC